jgi:hypothetical protein
MPPPLRADFDGNLVVDEADFDRWQSSFGITNPYDADGDGDADGRDFLYWQRNVYSQLPPEKLAIADLNHDGVYNAQDLPVWQTSYGVDDGGDVDGDGDTDGRDFLLWQQAAMSNPADLNGDYVVDSLDLEQWQQSYAFLGSTDANHDGVVDQADYQIWEAENGLSWNYPYAMTAPPLSSQTATLQGWAVPEPTSVVLVGFLVYAFSLYLERGYGRN